MSSRCSEDSPRVVVVVVTGLRLHSYVLCCVSCVPPYLPLPAYYPIARVLGVVLVRLISLVIMRVCVHLHGTLYPMMDCVLYLDGLLCRQHSLGLLMFPRLPYNSITTSYCTWFAVLTLVVR